MLFQRKPQLDHFRRFGCLANKLILPPQLKSSKFGSRSKQCIMVGYVHDTTKIWRLYDPESKRVIHTSDVIFDESTIVGQSESSNEISDVLEEVQSIERIELAEDTVEEAMNGLENFRSGTPGGAQVSTGHREL